MSANLMSVYPSKDTSSWFDKHSKNISDGLTDLSKITDNVNAAAANIIKTSNV